MRVGVDIGGTFTDFIILTGVGDVLTTKVHSTPSDPSQAFLEGIQGLMDKGLIEAESINGGSTAGRSGVG